MIDKSNKKYVDNDIKTHKKMVALIISFSTVIVVLIALFFYFFIFFGNNKSEVEETSDGRGVLVSVDNVESVIESAYEDTTAGYYTVSMSIDWVFQDGYSKTTNVYVDNVIENTNMVYFDLMLADNGEIIYESPYIPLGETLTDFSLDKPVEAGTYDAIIEYHLVDENNNYAEIDKVSVSITLHILN